MLIFNQLDTKESSFLKSFNTYLEERNKISGEVSQLVSEIILKIRRKGDNALKDLTKEFDGFDSDVFKISSKEINQILKSTRENGYVIISVFSYEGPKTCSSLPVKQYDENSLS